MMTVEGPQMELLGRVEKFLRLAQSRPKCARRKMADHREMRVIDRST